MSFVAPFWLAVAGIVAAGVVIAHLFSTSTPPHQVLPTARFVPQGAPTAVLRTTRLTDPLLLLLRVLAVLLIGLALAGAHRQQSGPRRVVLVDASRAAGAAGAGEAAQPDGADRLIVFDSVPRTVDASVRDTLRPTGARGSLSAALVAAHREISRVSTGRDEIELVIRSPLVQEEIDSATRPLLALWEGPVRIQRSSAAPVIPRPAFEVRAVGDDPVVASLGQVGKRSGVPGVRVLRSTASSGDSAWARQGGVLVQWPVFASSASSASSGSAAWAVSDGRHTVVGLAKPDQGPVPGTAVLQWSDGSPAATESPLGAGCVRDVAVAVEPAGDLVLRGSFAGIVESLIAPCGGARDFTPVPDSLILPRTRPREAGLVPRDASRLPLLLAALALLALLAEQLLRRKGGRG